MTSRDVGGAAEGIFMTWCSNEGITANKATEDKKGWDFFVQFPGQEAVTSNTPLDIVPPELTCLVQCKGTDRNIHSWQITLSNWQRFVKLQLPSFFLILAFEHQPYPQRGYLVHVDAHWMAQVLKRLRELPQNAKLNRLKLALKWSEKDALPELNGRGLRQAIVQHIGKDMQAYVLEKTRRLETIGYDKGRYRISVRMKANTNDELMTRLTDFAIGLIEKIPVAGMEFSQSRFGIAIAERNEDFDRAELSMERKPDRVIHVRLRDAMNTKSMVLKDAKIYHPRSVFPFIEWNHIKVRISTDLVDIVMHFSNQKLDLNFRILLPQEPFSLDILMNFYRLAEVMDAGTEYGLVIEVLDPDRGPVPLGRTIKGYELPEVIQQLLGFQDTVWLLKHVDLDRDAVIRLEQVAEQQHQFRLFRAVVEQPETIWLEVDMERGEFDEMNIRTIGTVFSERIEVGKWFIVLYVGLKGGDIVMTPLDESQVRLNPASVSVLTHKFRVVHRDEVDEENHARAIEAVRRQLEGCVDWLLPSGNH